MVRRSRQTLISATGVHGIVGDMVPQTFMVILMSLLIPSILTRRRRVTGALSWHDAGRAGAPYNIFLWAGLAALLGTSLVLALSWLILPALLPVGVSFDSLLRAKAAFGALLAAAVTPWAITKALC